MYSEKIEALIKAALTDGKLTEKERQILINRAQSEGIDVDEFEMVLDARLIELANAETEQPKKSSTQSNKLGDVRKCPQCGSVIGTFHMHCPDCGFEFSGVGPNKFVEKFAAELQSQLDKQDGGKNSLYDLFDPTGLYKDKRANAAIVKAENIFVKNYPLPMTKGDCIEMLNYMLPRIQLSGSTGSTRAWRNKYFAIIAKLEHENIGNQEVQKQVASFKAQAKISTLGEVLIWYKALTGFAKGIIWLVLFYVIIGIISSIALVD